MPPSIRSKQGFTLIELLVVIAILGVLAAMLMPGLSKSIERSNVAKCANNLRQLATAANLYSQDNNGMILRVTDNNQAWAEILAPYVEKVTKYDQKRVMGVFSCPKGKAVSGGGTYTDYGKNYYANGQPQDTWGAPHHQALTQVGIAEPSKVLLFADSTYQSLDPGRGIETVNGYNTRWGVNFRHEADKKGLGGKANVVFFDAHVEQRKETDFPSTGSYWNNYPWNPTP